MTTFKEFQGKTLDEAIQEACDYYGVGREKLEIEILNDAKTGIFGLVSVKKARIKAGRMSVPSLLGEEPVEKTAPKGRKPAKAKPEEKRPVGEATAAPAPEQVCRPEGDLAPADQEASFSSSEKEAPAPRRGGKSKAGPDREEKKPGRGKKSGDRDVVLAKEEPAGDFLPDVDLGSLDPAELSAIVGDTLRTLVEPIVGDVPMQVTVEKGRIRVHVDCGEASGLLVGREGQTLASLQYIAGRVIGKKIGGAVRLHIDAGNYRERQDGKLAELALSLAEKVKATGKSQSTRLLSAYQRRIIHLALENDEAVQTVSKGEGGQRRVVIQMRRSNGRDASQGDETSLVSDMQADIAEPDRSASDTDIQSNDGTPEADRN